MTPVCKTCGTAPAVRTRSITGGPGAVGCDCLRCSAKDCDAVPVWRIGRNDVCAGHVDGFLAGATRMAAARSAAGAPLGTLDVFCLDRVDVEREGSAGGKTR